MGRDSKVKEPMEELGNGVSHEFDTLSWFWVSRLCNKYGYPNSETDLEIPLLYLLYPAWSW